MSRAERTDFDRELDFAQGREDALNGFPRASTRPYYRQGYDRGLSESIDKDRGPYINPKRVHASGSDFVTGVHEEEK